MADYPQSFRACKLYRKTSKAGGTYFTGRWGGAKIAVVKTRETGDNGEEIWSLLLSQAPAPQKTDDKTTASASAGYSGVPRGNHPGVPDVDIPFAPEVR